MNWHKRGIFQAEHATYIKYYQIPLLNLKPSFVTSRLSIFAIMKWEFNTPPNSQNYVSVAEEIVEFRQTDYLKF
jgi:hypothetical protein